jgi:tetratricopeptide (TPR) repeat protein/nucleoside phosphorylase
MKDENQSFDICIVCALYEEASAVIDEFETRCGVSFARAFRALNQLEYRHTTIQNQRGESLTVFVTWLSRMGPQRAALDLAPLLHEIHPRFVAMTGVCAGDRRKVKLGDLIVATDAYHPEEGKIARGPDGQPVHYPETRTAGATTQVIQYVQGFKEWREPVRELKRQQLKRAWKAADEPQCHVVVMASSMAVRADNPFPAWTAQHHRKTVGIDMEAAAFYTALDDFPLMHGLAVKGVSDYGDNTKADRYRDYARRASAVYLLHFIQQYVTQETMPRRDTPPSKDRAGPLPLFMVPHSPNPFFTGRDDLLATLALALHAGQPTALSQPQALSGLGGVGKTQVAIAYTYRHAQDYQAVFWVSAASQETLLSGFAAIADLLQVPERYEPDQYKSVAAVKRWLQHHRHWLLILDGAEDLSLLSDFLPPTRPGHLLLTTCAQALGGLANRIEVTPLDWSSGVLLLLRRAGLLPLGASLEQAREADLSDAQRLWQEVGGLPLALDQAGAFIEETRCSLRDYLHLYQTQRSELLRQRGGVLSDHTDSVYTTFTLAANAAAQRNGAVRELLQVCALLHPDAIPEEVFRQGTGFLSPLLEAECADLLKWNKLLATAGAYSLLERQPEKGTLSIHRLVQAVLCDSMEEQERELWDERVTKTLDTVFPESGPAAWEQCERLLLHALTCLERAGATSARLETASLATKAATYLRARARYVEAEPLYQQALRIGEQALGPEHLDVAESQHNLANLYAEQGKYGEARLYYQRALRVKEALLKPEHPSLALSLHCLANLSAEQGKYAEAKALYQRALRIYQQTPAFLHSYEVIYTLGDLATLYQELGEYAEAETLYQQMLQVFELMAAPPHPGMALLLNNLAVLYKTQGKYAAAEQLYQRALHIREQILGPEHPDVAQSLHNLANLRVELSQYAEAEQFYQRALRIRRQVFGSEHPDVAKNLLCLAILYHRQGRYNEAEQLYQQILQMYEREPGTPLLSAASCLGALANLYVIQGRYQEAYPLYQRALQVYQQELGPLHPSVAQSLDNLANLLADWAKCDEAEPLYRKALQIREQKLGPLHPDVAQSLNNLATLFCQKGKYAEAEPLYLRALDIREQVLGPEHPETASSLNNLASLYTDQGRYSEAQHLFQRALHIRERVLGSDHPDTANTLFDFAMLWQAQESYEEARSFYERALTILIRALGPAHPYTIDARRRLRAVLVAMGKTEEAALFDATQPETAGNGTATNKESGREQ